ncbi:MAG: SpoIIE family protein phosphatase [Spirochaetota bacterium]
MRLYYEWGSRQIHKKGEELCGDSLAVSRHTDSVTLSLADGLGSGVKANILATLTTRIAMHMLENELPLSEVVQTLSETLPLCRERNLAYSTFAIAQFFTPGFARLVEYDSPAAILLRKRFLQPIFFEERCIEGKNIRESLLDLEEGDWIVFVSDGVINAGIGGVYPLGWGWEKAAEFIREQAHPDITAQDLADRVGEAVSELYAGPPGDDVSVAVIKVRKKLAATVLTGPPAKKSEDAELVKSFLSRPGRRAVCGGTTAKLVARYSGKALEVDLKTMTPDVPPIGRIEGIDIVSEGILTLTKVSNLLLNGAEKKTVRFQVDGASSLLRLLLEVDHVHFIVGQAVNPAHQNPELPDQLGIRLAVVKEIADELKKLGKEVTIEPV